MFLHNMHNLYLYKKKCTIFVKFFHLPQKAHTSTFYYARQSSKVYNSSVFTTCSKLHRNLKGILQCRFQFLQKTVTLRLY